MSHLSNPPPKKLGFLITTTLHGYYVTKNKVIDNKVYEHIMNE